LRFALLRFHDLPVQQLFQHSQRPLRFTSNESTIRRWANAQPESVKQTVEDLLAENQSTDFVFVFGENEVEDFETVFFATRKGAWTGLLLQRLALPGWATTARHT
jgi:hypothetical protein